MMIWRQFLRPLLFVVCSVGRCLSTTVRNEELYMASCRRDLGMSSGAIIDASLSASSSYDEKSVGPINARIRQEKNGGAWCPKIPISKEVKEWLQVDLGELKVVSLVETQGRFGNGQGQEFAPNYMLEYQRSNSSRWIRYRDKKGTQVIKGNSNTYIAELRELHPPIIARRIRFIPWSNHPRMMCMRVELYGCQWTDGVTSYSMRQGDKRGPDLDLSDLTYDGVTRDGWLSDGLGQLVDWEEGNGNFRLDLTGQGRKGFEWIGWKNDSNSSTFPLEIVFHFDGLRNFTSLKLHANNAFSKDVSVFRKLHIYFSVDGMSFGEGSYLLYEYPKDYLFETARHVIVPLPHRLGASLKLVFFYDLRWIMISEVRFESEIVRGSAFDYFDFNDTSFDLSPSLHYPGVTVLHPRGSTRLDVPTPFDHLGYSILPGQRESNTDLQMRPKTTSGRPGLPNHLVDSDVRRKVFIDDSLVGIVVGVVIAFVLLFSTVTIIIVYRHRRKKYSRAVLKSDLNTNRLHFKIPLNSTSSNGKISKGNIYKSIATNEMADCEKDVADGNVKMATFRQKDGFNPTPPVYELSQVLSAKCHSSEFSRRNCTAHDLERYSIAFDHGKGVRRDGVGFFPCQRKLDPTLTLVPPLPPRRLQQGSSAGNVHSLKGTSPASDPCLPKCDDVGIIREIPQQSLRFIEKLGEGLFRETYLCEACFRLETSDVDETSSNRSDGSEEGEVKGQMVIVKMLRLHSSDQSRLDFCDEMKVSMRLKDSNIVGVLGVCPDDPWLPAYVLEYPRHGDLHQFLLSHLPENAVSGGPKHQQTLSYGCLIYMATQVASGMKYLETMDIIHRDLAARNCLVGGKYSVKIVDFGVCRSSYSGDYYRAPEGDLVPLRWTAWEGVLQNKFSCKSDVWSFGVTLWEVMTLARLRPFESLTDDQVVSVCDRFRMNDCVDEFLTQPKNCPKEIFDLMKECWNGNEAKRPSFREIHMFLQQKNVGYDPREH